MNSLDVFTGFLLASGLIVGVYYYYGRRSLIKERNKLLVEYEEKYFRLNLLLKHPKYDPDLSINKKVNELYYKFMHLQEFIYMHAFYISTHMIEEIKEELDDIEASINNV